MLDLQKNIKAGLAKANARPVIGAPFDLDPQTIKPYFEKEKIAGQIADDKNQFQTQKDDQFVGYWSDRQSSQIIIKNFRPSKQFLFLGGTHQIGRRLVFSLWKNGFQEVVCICEDGAEFHVIKIRRFLLDNITSIFQQKIKNVSVVDYCITESLDKKGITFENAFNDLFKFGQFLRLPGDEFESEEVLIMSGSLGPGGAERQIHYTAIGLSASQQFDVSVACNYLEPPGDFFKSEIEEAGVKVLPIPGNGREFKNADVLTLREVMKKYEPLGFEPVLQNVLASAFLIQRLKPSIAHLWMDATNVCSGIAAELVGVPQVILGGRSMAPDNFGLHQDYMKPGYHSLMKNGSPTIINNSRAGATDYARWLEIDSEYIEVINNGMNFPSKPDSDQISNFKREYNISENAKILGGIFRFSEEKQPRLWVDTAVEVVKLNPEIIAIAFGSGILHDEMVDYVKCLGLEKQILFPGVTDNVWLAVASMDVLVMTSRLEGFPNVLLEAQGMGTPIVCTAKGGMIETYIDGATGISVHEATPIALAKAYLGLINDTKRLREMAGCAYAHARNNYSVERMVKKTCELYKRDSKRIL